MRKQLLALFLIFYMIFSLVACNPNGASKPIDEADTIKIGCILPLSGGAAYIGQLEREGVQYCVDYYNEKGGIQGKKVEVIFADSVSTPDIGVTELERLVTQEHIVAVTGPFNSSVTVAMAPLCEKYKIPFVIISASSIEVLQQGYKYTFRPGNNNNTNSRGIIGVCDMIEEKFGDKIENVAILYANDEWGATQSESFETLFNDAKMNIVFNETFETGSADFSSSITKIKESGAEILVPVMDNFSDVVMFIRQLKEYKVNIGIIGSGGILIVPEFIEALGPDANFIISTDVWHPDFLGFLRGDKAVQIHQGYIDKYGHRMGEQAGMAWLSQVTLMEAMNRADGLSGEQIRDSLANLKIRGDDEAALLLPYEIEFGNVEGMENQNIHSFSMLSQIIDGEWRSVYPDEILGDNPIIWPPIVS